MLKKEQQYQYHTLSNGLRIISRRTPSAVVYAGVYIDAGARDEQPGEEGSAHFVEHGIFKGTSNRKAYHILSRIDGVGGELDAFTTKEETCLYASAPKEYLERCIELFADQLFHSTFPSHEIEKEKDVIVEEINSYKDSPAEQIFDDFEEMVFAGHPLGHNILGSKKNVRGFSSEHLQRFMAAHYTPARMVVSVIGDVRFERVVSLCERYFGGISANEGVGRTIIEPAFHAEHRVEHRRTHQMHLLMGCPAPSLFSPDKGTFMLLNSLMGDGAMSSRLNMAIREHYGYCYTIESQYVPFRDGGLFYIYTGAEPETEERLRALIWKELSRVASEPMTERQLRATQRQFFGQLTLSSDSHLNEMQQAGKSHLLYSHVDSLEETRHEVLSITADDLQRVASTFFQPDRWASLCYK